MAKILDACCGSRMFWFDKSNEDVVFMDNRQIEDILCDGRKLEIKPDIVADFRKMPFQNNTFRLVVFDPPHLIRAGEKSWLAKKIWQAGTRVESGSITRVFRMYESFKRWRCTGV